MRNDIRPEPAPSDDRPLIRGARELGIELTSTQIELFARYQSEILDWNQRVNLTSITDPDEVQVRHFLDSFTVLAGLPASVGRGEKAARLIDVGAGAGLPGIALAIVRPKLEVTLLEATQKKCRFLEHAVRLLGLANLRVACGRAEELAHLADQRTAYDVVVARAVGPLAVLVELGLPYLRVGGRLIAPKKRGIEAEITAASRALAIVGGRLLPSVDVTLPILDEARQLVVVEKVRPTPRAYPRRPGQPSRSPL